jgi:large subunit ribosomal protein L29
MKANAERARALDTNEIRKELHESSEQMFRLRFQLRMGQTDGLKKLRALRKERARMLTVLRERELHPETAAAEQAEAAAHEKARKKLTKKGSSKKEAKKAAVKKAEAKKEAPKQEMESAPKPAKAKAPAAKKKGAPKPLAAHKPVRTPRPASKG